MLKKYTRFLAVIILMLGECSLQAQDKWTYTGQFNFGGNILFTYGKGQRFPGLKLFAGFSATALYKNHVMLSYGPSLAIYTKSLGANLNPLTGDWQTDLTQSFSVGYGWDDLSYYKYFRTLNNGAYYNMATNKSYALLLSSNIILNNHKRNQAVGSVTLSAPGVTINYYNDGAVPFNFLALADNFDRWWTGGLSLFFHNRQDYNYAELSFDQFTGYSPLLYELSTMLGINVPQYNGAGNDSLITGKKLPSDFNTSAYNLKVFLTRGYGVDVGAIGSLVDKQGRAYGLQDIIHILGGYALHPNSDITRFYIGGTYNNLQHVRF
jgi:Bacterial toxin 23